MNFARNLGTRAEVESSTSFEEQIEMVKKLKELEEAGILTAEEFDTKKKEIMGL